MAMSIHLHFKPARHGYLGAAKNGNPSLHRQVARGMYAIDWAAPLEIGNLDLE